MKKIEAIIKPYKLEEVKNALAELGIEGMTVSEVRGFGRQNGSSDVYPSNEHSNGFVPKIKIDLVVPEPMVRQAAAAIVKAARTGKIGDGKVFISPIEEVVRIRTLETGEGAI